MKFNKFIKLIPFLLTLLLIVFINVSNQKVKTKLRLLIWNTPSFSLGSYIAISIGAGFIFSYISTTNIAYLSNLNQKKSLKYRNENNEQINNESVFQNFKNSSEKILIERDINDPSPTMNAQFRVIGKTEKYSKPYTNDNIQYDNADEFEKIYDGQYEKNETDIQEEQHPNDWNDDSFTNW